MKMILKDSDCVKKSGCLICGSSSLEVLCRLFSTFCPRLFHKVVICQDCGHIQIYPLFSESEFTSLNEKFFSRKYLANGSQNPNNIRKENKLDKKLAPHLTSGLRVLDVGPGEAWAMDYFHAKECNYHAIEPVVSFADSIRKRGGTVIGESLFSNYQQYKNYFDIVIFRHVLEHMLNPYEALLQLKYFLKKDGLLYLALPNASEPSIKKGFRTSYLRPVHVSYFCSGNVLRLAASAGLGALDVQSDEEICCLLKRSPDIELKTANFYRDQKKIFIKSKHKAMHKDLLHIGRYFLGRIFSKRLCKGFLQS